MQENFSQLAPAQSLRLASVGKTYGGKPVLHELSFEVSPGDIVSLTGPNGSGKSTTLRLAAGTERPDVGHVTFRGQLVDDVDVEFRRAAGIVLDDFGFLPDLTAGEHLDLMARAHSMDDVEARIAAALESLNIDHVSDQLPITLSSGQRHRLALASIVVRDTKLLILDEPEQRMDTAGRAWLAAYLRRVADEGVAVLLASHDTELLERTNARCVELSVA